jgi:ankyrin repeat protein
MREQLLPLLAVALLVACGKPVLPPSNSGEPALSSAEGRALAAAATVENDLALDTWNAAREGDIEGLKLGLAGGIKVDAKDPNGGGTLLMAAVIRGQHDSAELLIEKGASLELENSKEETALHRAAFFCRPEMVELLLEKGADVNAMNKRGKTPLDVVEEPWDAGLEGYYKIVHGGLKIRLDLENIKSTRPKIAELLGKNGGKSGKAL